MFKDKVIELLNEADNDICREFFNAEISDNLQWNSDETNEFLKLLQENKINFKLVDRHGGEGEGEQYWAVYSFSDGQEVVFIKFDGYYMSYDGSTYENFYEVKAVEKLVTFYETKA